MNIVRDLMDEGSLDSLYLAVALDALDLDAYSSSGESLLYFIDLHRSVGRAAFLQDLPHDVCVRVFNDYLDTTLVIFLQNRVHQLGYRSIAEMSLKEKVSADPPRGYTSFAVWAVVFLIEYVAELVFDRHLSSYELPLPA